MQGAYVRQQTINHDPDNFQASARLIDDMVANHGVREWLSRNEPDWRPDFREFVYQRLAAVTEGLVDEA